jgi:penicillin-insensitive murein endopeptidase
MASVRPLLPLLAAALVLATLSPAAATPGETTRTRRRTTASQSIGLPFRGSLRRGVLLSPSEHIRYVGEYAAGGHFYGTDELVNVITRAADHVARRRPGARLSIGELSAQHGGALAGHRSHRNGRDVDISFYMLDAAGEPYDPYAFANFDRHGQGLAPNESLRFDDIRNWELVSRLVTDPDARVQYIFVADTLRARLIATAHRRHASARAIHRAETVMMQPSHGHPHRNHFHVRIYCPPADRPACEDREPFHAWYPGTPPVAHADASEPDGT